MGLLSLPSRAAVAFALFVAWSGCATWRPAPDGAGAKPDAPRWVSALERDHPMVGLIQDVDTGASISLDELLQGLEGSPLVLLGEQHPNVDHHRWQARLLRALVEDGRRPAVVFEQFDVEDQQAMDAALASVQGAPVPERATALAAAVAWTDSGWPPFDDYRPVVEEALAARLPIYAGNLSRERMHASAMPESAAVGSSSHGSAEPAQPALPAPVRASLEAEIRESHCGYANEAMVEAMVALQRRRDATMAAVMLDALEARPRRRDGVVLIAGFGHTRLDYGVPLYLREKAPGDGVVSVAFVEVLPGRTTPSAYADAFHSAELPFDYVGFTPRSDDEDPCEKFRASLEKMKARHGAASAPPASSD